MRSHIDWREKRMLARTLGHGEERVPSVVPKKGRIMRSYLDWRGEQVSVRTLGLKGVDCEISHRLGRRTKHSL